MAGSNEKPGSPSQEGSSIHDHIAALRPPPDPPLGLALAPVSVGLPQPPAPPPLPAGATPSRSIPRAGEHGPGPAPQHDPGSTTSPLTLLRASFADAPPLLLSEVAPAATFNIPPRSPREALHELRAEVSDLRDLLCKITAGQAHLSAYAEYVQKAHRDIGTLMRTIDAPGEGQRHLQNLWERMVACPLLRSPGTEVDAQQQLHDLAILDEACGKMVLQICLLTIPQQVNEWLQNAPAGYCIPFHRVFAEELPEKEDRQRVLCYLATEPHLLKCGIADTASGLIYRYAPSALMRAASLLLLGFTLCASTAVLFLVCQVPIARWPLQPGDVSAVLVSWFALLIGLLVHVGVDMTKWNQTQGRPAISTLSDSMHWVNARIGGALFKIALALFGTLALFFLGGPEKATALNAFLVGYSLDSFVGLFGASIEQRAAAQIAVLTRGRAIAPGG